jgi:hypothetical protein
MCLLLLRRQNETEQARASNLSVVLNTTMIHVTAKCLNALQQCKVKFTLLFVNTIYDPRLGPQLATSQQLQLHATRTKNC